MPVVSSTDESSFQWGQVNGAHFITLVDAAYEAVVYWRRNLFPIPSNSNGRFFIHEATKLLHSFAQNGPLAVVAMKAVAIMPHLLLQRPHSKSTTAENKENLARRLELWKCGDISALTREARFLQKYLSSKPNRISQEQLPRLFTKLMLLGKVHAATRILTEDAKGGVLPLSMEVRAALHAKHPPAEPATSEMKLSGCPQELHPILFSGITADAIKKAVLHTHGAAGPSGADAEMWRSMCLSFQSTSANLCEALAAVARRLATEIVDSASLEAFLANRLIPLDKCPGIRPIGIGEVIRRIIGKTIIRHLRQDIQQATGPIQLCAGMEAGCEAAIHAMTQMFNDDESDGLLLVDADNAFNRVNRAVSLWNMQFLCPSLSTYARNCYQTPSRLFVTGGAELSSQEGTTQGDPLAMPFYALSLMPLIHELQCSVRQIWYADDAQAVGCLSALRQWWDILVSRGPGYGYFVNASKTNLVVKSTVIDQAITIFNGTGVQIAEGARDLGAAVGSETFVQQYVTKKISGFCKEMEYLSKIAESSPQAAHAAFVHGVRHRWLFLQRTLADTSNAFEPLENIIKNQFIPALLGGKLVNEAERSLLSLPGRFGGLAIDNPVLTAHDHYGTSKRLTTHLASQLTSQDSCFQMDLKKKLEIKLQIKSERDAKAVQLCDYLKSVLPSDQHRAMLAAQDKGASVLVTTLPIEKYGFALSKMEFRDQLLMRYKWPLPDLPTTCSCGASFDLNHSQICHLGGFINMRHDELRNLMASEMKQVLHDVEIEPRLAPLSGEILQPRTAISSNEARSDIRARGFWQRQRNAFFDIRIFYPHASSYLSRNLPKLYASMEQSKKREYQDRILQVEQGSFTPLIFSSLGGMGVEASAAIKELAVMLSNQRNEPYSHTICLLRCRISFALMRASSTCLRGSRPRRRKEFCPEIPASLVMEEARL
jgi:hypothetical protein